MSRFDPRPYLAVERAGEDERLGVAAIGIVCSVWLAYTAWFSASPTNRLGVPCIFYHLTGHPCPFCGGTRGYGAMWHLDIGAAAHVYPLAPLMFPATFALVGYSAWSLLARRGLRLQVGGKAWWVVGAACVAALAISWTLKWVWLGY